MKPKFAEKRRDGNSNNDKTVKSVAIVVGGAAALCFGFICLFFIKSLAKKDDGKHKLESEIVILIGRVKLLQPD